MAKFLSISDNALQRFTKDVQEAINKKLTSPAARARLTNQVKPFIAEEIAHAIAGAGGTGNTVAARAFQPLKQPNADDIVGRLGVGDDGRPNREKLSNGWRLLIPSRSGRRTGETAVSVNGSFSASGFRAGDFGRFEYLIDLAAFYNARVNTFGYFSRKTANGSSAAVDALVIIPWMKNFIEGTQVSGYGFVRPGSKTFNKTRNSPRFGQITRTGLGYLIRIPSGSFRIQAAAPNPFDVVLTSISRKFRSTQFSRELERRIVAALR